MIQLLGVDAAGFERDAVFEYELPFNFQFEDNLYSNFSALSLMKGEFVGFLFSNSAEKSAFDGTVRALQGQLTVPQQVLQQIKQKVENDQKAEMENQLEE